MTRVGRFADRLVNAIMEADMSGQDCKVVAAEMVREFWREAWLGDRDTCEDFLDEPE